MGTPERGRDGEGRGKGAEGGKEVRIHGLERVTPPMQLRTEVVKITEYRNLPKSTDISLKTKLPKTNPNSKSETPNPKPYDCLFAWCLTALSAHIGYIVP